MTFSYLLSFSICNEGTSKTNSVIMMSAQFQLAPLFYSFKDSKYQHLHSRDLCKRVQMPNSIKSYVERHESFLVSDFNNCGQGGDFIQEEANKTIKSFLLPGMSSSEIWKRVCWKATPLKKLKALVTQQQIKNKILEAFAQSHNDQKRDKSPKFCLSHFLWTEEFNIPEWITFRF